MPKFEIEDHMKSASESLLENLNIRLRISRQSNFAGVCRAVAVAYPRCALKRLYVVPNDVTLGCMYQDTMMTLNLDLR